MPMVCSDSDDTTQLREVDHVTKQVLSRERQLRSHTPHSGETVRGFYFKGSIMSDKIIVPQFDDENREGALGNVCLTLICALGDLLAMNRPLEDEETYALLSVVQTSIETTLQKRLPHDPHVLADHIKAIKADIVRFNETMNAARRVIGETVIELGMDLEATSKVKFLGDAAGQWIRGESTKEQFMQTCRDYLATHPELAAKSPR
jgi:hypothetical protein